jgi:hypothetical protein
MKSILSPIDLETFELASLVSIFWIFGILATDGYTSSSVVVAHLRDHRHRQRGQQCYPFGGLLIDKNHVQK